MLVANNLTTREDVETLMRGLRLSRRILRAPALAAVVDREILPSPDEHISDSDLEHHARKVAKTVYHPSCRSEAHTSEIQSLMRTSYAVFCLKKKKTKKNTNI